MKRIVVLLALLGMACGAPAASVRNDGFETGDFINWQIDGEGWRVSPFFRDSFRGVYGAVNDVWTNGVAEYRVLRQEIKASAGKVYQASVWLRAVCVEGTESFLEIQFMNREGSVLKQFQSEHVTHDQDFKLMTAGEMTAPDGTDRVSVRGVVHIVTQPVIDTDYHVFDNFDFRPAVPASKLPLPPGPKRPAP